MSILLPGLRQAIMPGFQLCMGMILLSLLSPPPALTQSSGDTPSPLHIQTIKSWCTSPPNEPRTKIDPPKAKCNWTAFVEQHDFSDYQPLTLAETDFLNCSSCGHGRHQMYQTLEANLTFRQFATQQVKEADGDWFTFGLQAPPSMIFKIRPENRGSWKTAELLEKHNLYDPGSDRSINFSNLETAWYSSSRNLLVRLPKHATGMVEFQLSIEAVLDCTNQLEVYCSADNEG